MLWYFLFVLIAVPMLAVSVGIAMIIIASFEKTCRDILFKERYKT